MPISGMIFRNCLLASLCAATVNAAPIQHEFIAIDEGKDNLLYVNENDPAKNWIVPIGKSHPRDMQLVGSNRVLIGNVTGYSEYDIATGKQLLEVTNFAPASAPTDTDEVTSVRRQPNGHTLVAGINIAGSKGIVVLDVDPQGAVKNKIVYPGTYIRFVRQTAAGTYLMACDTTIREGNSDGKYIWEAPVPQFSHMWKAVRLPNGDTLASAGYGGFMIELDQAKKVIRKFGDKSQVPAAVNSSFFASFQLLTNGDVVVANWQGHGPTHGSSGIQLLEFDKTGAIVWQWSKAELISSIQGILVLDGLNTALLYDERNGIQEPVK
jgi:type II secretory pathway pseudopilin PulG